MEYKEESKRENYPDCISLECTEKIIEQMKLKVCKIFLDSGNGTGFFCKIKFPNNKLIPVLITNNHFINEYMLKDENQKIYYSIYNQNELKYIQLNNRMKYTSPKEKYDITIIEIKENDDIKDNMFFDVELNENNIIYSKKSIYILHYPNEKISVSYGILNEVCEEKKYEFNHYCTTYEGSSGSPILDLSENRIIGIHKGTKDKYNLGTFINYPINEFIKENYMDKNLIEFNKKFNLDIKPNITKLVLRSKNIKCINYLQNLTLNELKELDLSECGIIDIKFLEKVKFDKFEKLNLGSNEISNINILEKVNFNELKELNLSNCVIKDIKFLEKVKFDKLEKLYLYGNEISNINILEKVNFNKLTYFI